MVEKSKISASQRERIRRGLLRYQALHGDIGTPALRTHMIDAFDADWDFIHLRALQNFLKGSRRTKDETVLRYAQFLEMQLPPEPEDEMAGFLSQFLISAPRRNCTPLAGEYIGLIPALDPEPDTAVQQTVFEQPGNVHSGNGQKEDENYNVLYSYLTLEVPEPEPYFLKATESVWNNKREPSFKRYMTEPDSEQPYNGLLFPCSPSEFILLLRNYLQTRVYLLTLFSYKHNLLRGTGIEPGTEYRGIFAASPYNAMPTFPVQFRPRKEGEFPV